MRKSIFREKAKMDGINISRFLAKSEQWNKSSLWHAFSSNLNFNYYESIRIGLNFFHISEEKQLTNREGSHFLLLLWIVVVSGMVF